MAAPLSMTSEHLVAVLYWCTPMSVSQIAGMFHLGPSDVLGIARSVPGRTGGQLSRRPPIEIRRRPDTYFHTWFVHAFKRQPTKDECKLATITLELLREHQAAPSSPDEVLERIRNG